MLPMQKTLPRQQGWVLAVLLAFGQLACGASSDNGPIKSTLCTESFTACGGDPSGTWNVVGVCLDGDLAAAYNSQHSDACASQTTGADLSRSGSATYKAATSDADAVVSYQSTTEEKAAESFSPDCAKDAYDITTLDANGCAQIQKTLQNGDAQKKVTCSLSGGNCDCRVTIVHTRKVQNMFTISDSTIVESDDSSYDFCVTGSTMIQRQKYSGNVNVITRMEKH